MSKLFFDHLVVLNELEHHIKHATESPEEREELWHLVDELVHHKVFGCILENLPEKDHAEFLAKFEAAPYDESIIDYLSAKIGKNMEEIIKQEVGDLSYEILQDLQKK